MPTVPYTPRAPAAPKIDETFAAMAAADLHEAGMLFEPKFDPEGSGYDMETAKAAGLQPDETGHWPSRDPNTGLILKGHGHKTYNLTEEGEAKAGYKISKGEDGRYYSSKEND